MTAISKQHLLQIAKAVADYLGLVAALTVALVQIYPDIINHIDPQKILVILGTILLFGALKGAASHIADADLRKALLAVLEAIERDFPKDDGGPPTRRVPSVDNPDNYRD